MRTRLHSWSSTCGRTNEKEGNGLAPLSGKCNEDVYRIADVASDPLKVDLLKEDLAPLVGTSGKTLTVLNWSIYYNKQVQKSGGGLSGVGIQGYSVPGKKKEKRPGSKCSKKESAGGWYQGAEVTSQYFPLISEFEGTFAGRPVSVRVVHSPTRKLEGKFEGEAGRHRGLAGGRAQDFRSGGHGRTAVVGVSDACAISPSCRPARSCCGAS